MILNLSASPWHVGKALERREHDRGAGCAPLGAPIVFVNQVGGNDELIFDGGSFVPTPGAHSRASAELRVRFRVVDLRRRRGPPPDLSSIADPEPRRAARSRAWCSASATTSASRGCRRAPWSDSRAASTPRSPRTWPCEALGAERVLGVAMPGPFSSDAQHLTTRWSSDACSASRSASRTDRPGLRRLPRALRVALRRARRLRSHAAEHPIAHPRRDS